MTEKPSKNPLKEEFLARWEKSEISFLPKEWEELAMRWGDEFWYSEEAFEARKRATYAVLEPTSLSELEEWSPQIVNEIVSILVHNDIDGLKKWTEETKNIHDNDSRVKDILNVTEERLSRPNPWQD